MKSSITKSFRKRFMSFLHQFKIKLLKPTDFGMQILITLAFSSNGLASAS
jgi:hypothetical protein